MKAVEQLREGLRARSEFARGHMMDEMEQAHHELDRLQGIITRYEGHIFTLRGWLLAVIGGLLAAYYTENIQMSEIVMWIGLPMVAMLFLFLEMRHANMVEAVVERIIKLEKCIESARQSAEQDTVGWYDGPRVSQACADGAKRWWPHQGMTFMLNRPFYVTVLLVIFIVAMSLPQRG